MKSFYPYLIIFSILILTIFFQANLLKARFNYSFTNPFCTWCNENDVENVDEVVFIPTNTLVLRSFAPADPDFTADLLWLRTAYYFGSHAVTDQDYFYLYYLLNKITDLAPGWEYPYHFGGIVLLLEADMPVQALKLTNKGLAFHKTSWELYFMKGYILWKAFNNYKGAAEQIFKASEIRGSPDYFAPLSVTLAQKTGDDIFTASFAQFVMNSLKDENQKKIIQKKMSGQSNQ